jgi:hypothetical protein
MACGSARRAEKVVDGAPAAYTTDGLRAWKAHAEMSAARDSTAASAELDSLLHDLDAAHSRLVDFSEYWQRNEPEMDFDEFEKSTAAAIAYNNARRAAYQRHISPGITSVIVRAEVLLGPSDAWIIESKQEAMIGPTNYIGMRMLAECLERIRAILTLH